MMWIKRTPKVERATKKDMIHSNPNPNSLPTKVYRYRENSKYNIKIIKHYSNNSRIITV
jgi:hypothetical protein